MTEPRIEKLEKELGSMEEQLKKQMEEMLAVLVDQLQANRAEDHSKSAGSFGTGKTTGRTESSNSFPKVAKLNFPKYDGTEDPTSWVCQVE
jgi:hypothetical protein